MSENCANILLPLPSLFSAIFTLNFAPIGQWPPEASGTSDGRCASQSFQCPRRGIFATATPPPGEFVHFGGRGGGRTEKRQKRKSSMEGMVEEKRKYLGGKAMAFFGKGRTEDIRWKRVRAASSSPGHPSLRPGIEWAGNSPEGFLKAICPLAGTLLFRSDKHWAHLGSLMKRKGPKQQRHYGTERTERRVSSLCFIFISILPLEIISPPPPFNQRP